MSSRGNAHALIIEDEMIIALELENLLRDLGYSSFDVATTPQEALQQATSKRPDLMTVDVRIVGGTGIEAVQAITQRLGEIPHFYVTGNVDMLAAEDLSAVVEKPIDARRFRRAWAAVTGPEAGRDAGSGAKP